MASIMDLPNELLCWIGNFLLPLDIEAFALANKRCYSGIKPLLDDHLTLKRQYSAVRYGILQSSTPETDGSYFSTARSVPALQHIVAIIQNPTVALYPTTMRVGYCGRLGYESQCVSDNQEFRPLRESIIMKHETKLKEICFESQVLTSNLRKAASEALCEPNYEIHAVIIMLTLLPNLVSLSLDCWGFQGTDWDHCVYWAASVHRGLRPMQRQPFLAQLRDLTLTSDYPLGDPIICRDGGTLQQVAAFGMLPSIRTLRASRLYNDMIFDWFLLTIPFQRGSSTLTDVQFTASNIHPHAFASFLAGITALKRFTYHHCVKQWSRPSIQYQPVRLIDELRQYTRHSLEELNIEGTDCHQDPECETRSSHSLRGFRVLRKIRLEDQVFVEYGAELPDADGDSIYFPYHFCDKCGDKIVYQKNLPPMLTLAETLPSSIEHLTLVQKMNDADFSMLLDGLTEEERLTNLRDITVETPQGESEVRFNFRQSEVENQDAQG
ncbi:MAG: hypothetical protein Q9183_003321 [Haloplaca sp. 2 TL-2023]